MFRIRLSAENKTITYINTTIQQFQKWQNSELRLLYRQTKKCIEGSKLERRTELQLFLLRQQKQQNDKTENTGQTASMSLLTFVAQAAENLEATTATPTTKAKNLQKTRQNAGNYNKQGKPAGSSKRNLL